MYTLFALTFLGAIGIALSVRCHVTFDDKELHCGDSTNMTCSSNNYIPYCHQVSTDPNVQNNGICSCEKFCFVDDECGKGCGTKFVGKCVEVYPGSIEKICLCKSRV
ncbi:uncharacterized protein LOC132714955 [Ruditapes philippinarum]|uniref:uncharacterized protein LOC132714955 n=1 Tax=Ruditapes philippinarum TaxID=129788 RepID=UPI00295C378A|nr:uncharacterized protein LOC132714955 [Ruditapes philippinarum]